MKHWNGVATTGTYLEYRSLTPGHRPWDDHETVSTGKAKDGLPKRCSPEIHGYFPITFLRKICHLRVPWCEPNKNLELSAISEPRTWKAASNLSFRGQGLTTRDPLGFSVSRQVVTCKNHLYVIHEGWLMVGPDVELRSLFAIFEQFHGMDAVLPTSHECEASPRDPMRIMKLGCCKNVWSSLCTINPKTNRKVKSY